MQLRCDGNELPAQGGRRELAAAPLEEHDAEVIFQAADLLRDGRLRMPSRRAAREKLPASKTALTARTRELVSDMVVLPTVALRRIEKRSCQVVSKSSAWCGYKF